MSRAATTIGHSAVIERFDSLERNLDVIFDASRSITPSYIRTPESEIYGRSLSSVRRFGAFMIDKALPEVVESPEAAQVRVEFFTSVEEGFGTDLELGGGLEVRDFDSRPVLNGRVMSKDLKTAVSNMTEAGLKCAEETAKKDKKFQPQLTRSKWDHSNALIVDEMAQGKTNYNTRIVISPFPEEAAQESGDEYWRNIGYVPHLKRGFVQLYHFETSKGQVINGSLSFDDSDKRRLREVFAEFDIEIPEGEITDNWLQYAITANLSEEQAKELAIKLADKAGDPNYKKNTNTVDVTHKYKSVMNQVFNSSYIHLCESLHFGYQTEAAKELVQQFANKAHQFNDRYKKALYKMQANNEFTDDDAIVIHELLVYSTIEMMRALHLDKTTPRQESIHVPFNLVRELEYSQSVNPAMLQNMLAGFGAEGAKNGRTYSACGLSISLGQGNDDPFSIENLFNPNKSLQTAFGGNIEEIEKREKELEDCDFISKECPKCHKKDVKTVVKKGKYYGECGCHS